MIHDLAKGLGKALKESPEHQAFVTAKKRVKADRKAEQLIVDLRQKHFELAALQAQGKKPAPEQLKAVEALGKEAQAHAAVSEYFQAETKFGQLWSDVHRVLCEAVGVDAPKQP